MRPDREAEVLVVGAGPVGLFTALCLAERGVQVEIIDKYHRTASHSYALALHPQTLYLLDQLGLAGSVIEHGQTVERIRLHVGETGLGEIDLAALDAPFPFVLVLPQVSLESILEDRLGDKGVRVQWNHPALAFDARRGRVRTLVSRIRESSLRCADTTNSRVKVKTFGIVTSFLLGTDGYDSLTRRSLGIDYESWGGLTTHGLLEFGQVMHQPTRMDLVFREDSTDVLWPIGPDRGRWSLQLRNLEQSCEVERLQDLIRSRAPWFDPELEEVYWVTTVKFERRLAKRFGQGRIWLAGDSAHLTSPVGVQSMNVGLHEADDLARRISSILKGGRSSTLLEGYEVDSRREWRGLLGLDGRPEALLDAPPWAKGLADRLLSALPASGGDLSSLLEQIGLRFAGPRRRLRPFRRAPRIGAPSLLT